MKKFLKIWVVILIAAITYAIAFDYLDHAILLALMLVIINQYRLR